MSNIYKPLTSSGPIPPIIPTEFETQDGTAVPSANVLIIDAFESTENNINGITSKGGAAAGNPPGSGLTNEVSLYFTNRITGTATTTDGTTPVNVFIFPLGATPGTYVFTSKLTVFNITDGKSAGYASQAVVRTDGATGVLLGTGNYLISEEAGMEALDLANDVTANTLRLDAIGLAGKTIHYLALTEFIFVS